LHSNRFPKDVAGTNPRRVRRFAGWLSLTGSGLKSYEEVFLGWFGPRGLASILFLERFQIPGGDEILACVVLSIVLHGVSANPMAARFKRSGETRPARGTNG
jgi:NhaP-type Na+/H+ or K+/H+ antiporter